MKDKMNTPVEIYEGTPDMRYAQNFTREWGMGLSARLVVPTGLSVEDARSFVKERLEKAAAAIPELSFSVVIGKPDL